MKKVNFKEVEVVYNFEGEKTKFDASKFIGNLMYFNGDVLMDLGFDELAREIYKGEKDEVEIPDQYIPALEHLIKESKQPAMIKRALLNAIKA